AIKYGTSLIQFYYEDRPDVESVADGKRLSARAKRLKTIVVRAAGSLVRAYALAYAPSQGLSVRSRLVPWRQYGTHATVSADGVVSASTSLPPTSFGYDDALTTASDVWKPAVPGDVSLQVPAVAERPVFADSTVSSVGVGSYFGPVTTGD